MSAMTFETWCSYKKRVMGDLPAWFAVPQERQRRYEEYVRAFNSCCVCSEDINPQAGLIRVRAA